MLIRHEAPYYKDIGHDLTPEGVERAIHLGEDLVEQGIIDAKSRVDLLHSPKARARGTLEFIVKGAGLPSDEYFEVQEIRSSDYADLQTFLTREKDLGLTLDDVARSITRIVSYIIKARTLSRLTQIGVYAFINSFQILFCAELLRVNLSDKYWQCHTLR